jgi:3-oxoacyl-[acyl-carrier protein] reductase
MNQVPQTLVERALTGQVALVTGASRGIGRAIALKLGSLGVKVAVNYSSNEALAAEVVSALPSENAFALKFNVSDAKAVQAGIDQITARWGKIDILVNNAGITSDGLLVRTKDEDWTRTIDTNLSGSFYCIRAVAKQMMKARYGRIINISSVIGLSGNAGQAAYSASKSALFGLTKSIALELGSRNITVNSVAPGFIETDMTEKLSPEQRAEIAKKIPLERLGTVEDVAEVVAFFCQPGASYITGQVISVNGGLYM